MSIPHDKIHSMQQSLEKLRKFFRLEHENGYQNTAIIGGLAKMLDYWEGEARADGLKEEVIQAVVQRLRSYDGLSSQSRADALKGLWKRIGDTYPDTQQKSQQQKPRPQRQPQKQSEPAPKQEHNLAKLVSNANNRVNSARFASRNRVPPHNLVLNPSQAQRHLPRPPRLMPS